jgi:hypothetical protein
MTAHVLIAANGDTLVGSQRVSIKTLQPAINFAGAYAADHAAFTTDTLRFEKRVYRRSGVAQKRVCDELKMIGSYDGVPIFAEITAREPLTTVIIPLKPGIFQDYNVVTTAHKR